MSQWSTPLSGPLAARKSAETGPKARKSREPVVHSVEWTTSSPEKGSNQVRSPEKVTLQSPTSWLSDQQKQKISPCIPV